MTKHKINAYQIIALLFFWLVGFIMGSIYFYKVGQEKVNVWLTVTAWNDGYTEGRLRGGTEVMYLLFTDYINNNSYNVTDEMFDQKNLKEK